MSVVAKPLSDKNGYDNETILYCRGFIDGMRDILDEDPKFKEGLEEKVKELKKKGIYPIIYGYKILTREAES